MDLRSNNRFARDNIWKSFRDMCGHWLCLCRFLCKKCHLIRFRQVTAFELQLEQCARKFHHSGEVVAIVGPRKKERYGGLGDVQPVPHIFLRTKFTQCGRTLMARGMDVMTRSHPMPETHTANMSHVTSVLVIQNRDATLGVGDTSLARHWP